MAHPQQNDDDRNLEGIGRANRDDDQSWREKGWETIEGGRGADPEALFNDEPAQIGADFTRSPADPALVRDEKGNIRDDRVDVLRGYGEPLLEKNYPRAYDRDELVNTDFNPGMEFPRHTTPSFGILAIVLGLCLFGLLIAAMYWGFLAPVRRTPEGPAKTSKVEQKTSSIAGVQQFAAFVCRMNERH